MTLKDRMAVVTGAGSGLGRAIAQALAAAGAPVAAVDLDAATAEETAALIAKAGGKGKAFQADTSKAADVDRAVGGAISGSAIDARVKSRPKFTIRRRSSR